MTFDPLLTIYQWPHLHAAVRAGIIGTFCAVAGTVALANWSSAYRRRVPRVLWWKIGFVLLVAFVSSTMIAIDLPSMAAAATASPSESQAKYRTEPNRVPPSGTEAKNIKGEPKEAPTHGTPVEPAKVDGSKTSLPIWLPMAAFALVLLSMLLRYDRILAMARRSEAFYPEHQPDKDLDLLQSQKDFVNQMVRRITEFPVAGPGRMIALEGSWGSGKSTVIRALWNKLNATKGSSNGIADVAAAHINVWRDENEDDLHYRIVEAIALHPKLLSTIGHHYPLSYFSKIGYRQLRRVIGAVFRVEIPLPGAKLELGGSLIPLSFQEELQHIAVTALKHNIRLVFILDEIERAPPAVAQAVLTISRRSLDHPGITVVLPFVREQLSYKAFSPLRIQTADLYSTAMCELARQKNALRQGRERFTAWAGDEMASAPGKPITSDMAGPPNTSSVNGNTQSTEGAASKASSETKSETATQGASKPRQIEIGQHEEYFLLLDYARRSQSPDGSLHGHILHRIQEKYLTELIPMPRPMIGDVTTLIFARWNLPAIAEIAAHAGLSIKPEKIRNEFGADVEKALDKIIPLLSDQVVNFSLRKLSGEIQHLLAICVSESHKSNPLHHRYFPLDPTIDPRLRLVQILTMVGMLAYFIGDQFDLPST